MRSFRNAAIVCALNDSKFSHPQYKKAEVSVTLVIPDSRYKRDQDNALASLKPAIDGCVDAGIILGDSTQYLSYKMPIIWQVDKERSPMTILEFEGLEK